MVFKRIINCLSGKPEISMKKIQKAIDRSMEHSHAIRPPEDSRFMRDYYRFVGAYSLKRPDSSFKEAHDECMIEHPEWWPRTGPLKYSPS
jgi:hypothetical protein